MSMDDGLWVSCTVIVNIHCNAFSPSLSVAFSQSLVDHRLNLIEQVGTHQSSNTLKDILSEFDNSELQKNEWPVGVVAHGASVE